MILSHVCRAGTRISRTTSFGLLQISPVTLPKICILASLRHVLGQSLRQFPLRLGQDRSVGRVPGQRNGNGEPHECPCNVSDFSCIATHADPHLRNASLVEGLNVLPCRRGERVVRTTPSTLCKVVLFCVRPREQWKLSNPEEVRGTRWGIRSYTAKSQLTKRQP
jgi:hypothetical protein